MKSREILASSEATRLDLLGAISARRGNHLIAYLTSTRPGLSGSIRTGDIEIIEKHVRQAKADGARGLDFLVYTHGGATVAPWDFIAMVRDYFPDDRIGVILPSAAYSAGTMIALGADEIVAGPSTRFGPVDSTSGWESFYWFDGRNSTSALKGFMDLIASTGLKEKHVQDSMADWLTRHTDALALGEAYRTMRENRRILENIIDTRLKSPSKADRQRLVEFFLYEIGLHSQSVRRREARKNGVTTLSDIETSGIETNVVALFNHYADIMKLNSPFVRATTGERRAGDATDYDAYGEHASETPIIMIESLYESNAAYVAYGHRHWDEIPPIGAPADDAPMPAQPMPAYAVGWEARRGI